MVIESFNTNDTENIGKSIALNSKKGDIYCLEGDLGVGKTIFVKGFAKGLNIKENITSPTFNIVNEYYGNFKMYHFDMYRISSLDEIYDVGYEEYFFSEGICLIEWASVVLEIIPKNAKWINIQKDIEKDINYRKITII